MARIVTAARAWIGTPYVHQAARRGAGCDCLGLLRGVMAEASGKPLQSVPAYTPDWSEPQGHEVLWTEAAKQLIAKPIEDVQAGDVLLFRMRQGAVAKHVGVQAETGLRPTFIHSYQGHGVCENAFSTPWQRRLVARFAIPDFT
ncbi:NlpC/P60 family protein [Octadecabacter ascidiaceicola]|uniref:NlpC/P60 family protein n=1 Tax=Octadecabacter ascidiaceicola TaxID=1655543 RepID=A0A238JNA1_9RHOB|nr:NlpC/P60 family protein [Octadecabacter ascidiaceicola]SMX32139.1 NlpC/P60 family protein [Octadecabacter ascidiaceicola]